MVSPISDLAGTEIVPFIGKDDFEDPLFLRLVKQAFAAQRNYNGRRAYYQNEQTMAALGVTFPERLEVLRVAINWPRLTVDSIEERLDFDGIRIGTNERAASTLWDWWQFNNLDEESHLAHQEALVQKRAFVIIGPGASRDDPPAITVHDPRFFSLRRDRLTRAITDVVQVYKEVPGDRNDPWRATWYQPNQNVDMVRRNTQWFVDRVRTHNYGVTPVQPIVNRAGIGDDRGRSEMDDVIPFTDAAMRILTGTQVAAELVALPQRIGLGMAQSDFVNPDGTPTSLWNIMVGGFMMHPDPDAKVFQLPGADLRPFADIIDMLGRQVAAVTGLPHDYLGLSTDNPASAEAINAAKDRHIARVWRRGKTFSGSWEGVLRIAAKVGGVNIPTITRMEMVQVDPATPTLGSKSDAVLKLTGKPILPVKAGRQMMGYSPERILELEAMEAAELNDPWINPPPEPLAVTSDRQPVTPDDRG